MRCEGPSVAARGSPPRPHARMGLRAPTQPGRSDSEEADRSRDSRRPPRHQVGRQMCSSASPFFVCVDRLFGRLGAGWSSWFTVGGGGRFEMRIAPSIHRIGDSSIINAYLVQEANEVTVVDAGVSGLYRDLPRELASMGRTIADVRALVLTHGHSDHIGFAERLRSDRHIPVSVHEADAALARGEVPNPSKGFGPPSSPRSPASCGSRSCAVASEPSTCARSRRSVTARRSTFPGARSSPSPPATRRGAPCSTSAR